MSGNSSKFRERQAGTYFAIVTNDDKCRQNIKVAALDFKFYWYIDHVPDDEDGKNHTHLLVSCSGRQSIGQVARHLEIPSNYVQVVRNVTGFLRYLIHLDNPEKHQYKIEDVTTNYKQRLEIAVNGQQMKSSIIDVYKTFSELEQGRITLSMFIDEHYNELNSLSFSQKINILSTLSNIQKQANAIT